MLVLEEGRPLEALNQSLFDACLFSRRHSHRPKSINTTTPSSNLNPDGSFPSVPESQYISPSSSFDTQVQIATVDRQRPVDQPLILQPLCLACLAGPGASGLAKGNLTREWLCYTPHDRGHLCIARITKDSRQLWRLPVACAKSPPLAGRPNQPLSAGRSQDGWGEDNMIAATTIPVQAKRRKQLVTSVVLGPMRCMGKGHGDSASTHRQRSSDSYTAAISFLLMVDFDRWMTSALPDRKNQTNQGGSRGAGRQHMGNANPEAWQMPRSLSS